VLFPKNNRGISTKAKAKEMLNKLEEFANLEVINDGNEEKNINSAYEMLWAVNSGNGDEELQNQAFHLVLCAYRPLTPNELLEAIRFDSGNPDEYREEIEKEHLEPLYYNFLRVNSQGFLEFEHISAKVFVTEMKEENSQLKRFSDLQNHRVMADISIKAMERPTHQLWSDAKIYLLEWEAGLSQPDTFDQTARLLKHNQAPADLDKNKLSELRNMRHLTDHFGQYLSIYWMRHCRKIDSEGTQRIWDLIQKRESGFQGWSLACAVFRSPDWPWDGFSVIVKYAYQALHINEQGIFSPSPFLSMASFGIRCGDDKQETCLPTNSKDLEAQNRAAETPLLIASYMGYWSVVKDLVGLTADVNAKNTDGTTALHIAAADGDAEAVELLLQAGAKIEIQEDGGGTPLARAIESGSEVVIEALFAGCAQVNYVYIPIVSELKHSLYRISG
jgi:Ankyrin repeats (3 copies)